MKAKNAICLAATAFIFGVSFVAQDAASVYVSPFTFNCLRFFVAAVFLFALAFGLDIFRKKTNRPTEKRSLKTLIVGGAPCGLALGAAITCQQFGFMDENMTSGKCGFISSCYILVVPIVRLFFGKKAKWTVWVGIALALGGLYLLCIGDVFALSPGDIVVMCCALGIAAHIMLCDRFAPKCDCIKLSAVQCLFISLISLPLMFIFETPSVEAIGNAVLPVLFCGLVASGAGYTLQLIGQNGANPTAASMIMSLESVVSAVAGAIVLGQLMTIKQIIGCALIFAAVVLAQLPDKKKDPPESASKNDNIDNVTENGKAESDLTQDESPQNGYEESGSQEIDHTAKTPPDA